MRRDREKCERELQALELAISKAESRLDDLEAEIAGTTERRTATRTAAGRTCEIVRRSHLPQRVRSRRSSPQCAQKQKSIRRRCRICRHKFHPPKKRWAGNNRNCATAETTLMANERALAERQSRLEILQQLNAEGAGLTEGSQAVLRGLDDPERILPALKGALASLIEVDDEFIPTIEAALGRNLHAIVLRNDALADEIIATLTTRKLGQTALITPELTASAEVVAQELPPGALGWATEKVHAPAELEPLVKHLLGEVALVSDLTAGTETQEEIPAPHLRHPGRRFRFRERRHLMVAPSTRRVAPLFARKAQMTALAAEHSALLEERENLRKSRDEIHRQVEAAIDHLDEVREQYQAARGEHSAITLQATALERELHEANRKVDALEWERSTLAQQMDSSAERIAQLESDAAAQRSFLADATRTPDGPANAGRNGAFAR